MTLIFGAATDTGLVRRNNEDRYSAHPETGLFLVVDGVGGQNAGEVAAEIVCNCIEAFIRDTDDDEHKTWPFGIDLNLSNSANRLRAAILMANKKVAERLEENPDLTGMAATMSAVLLRPRAVVVANVGDCRGYLLREDQLEQLTVDHSWVAEQVRAGALDLEAARAHPMRNLVTRAISGDQPLDIQFLELETQSGDVFLMCSDGLSGMLTDAEIQDTLTACLPDADRACAQLVAEANERGGKDNVTVVIAAVP